MKTGNFKTRKPLTLLIGASICLSIAFSGSSAAQGMTDEQIDQMAAMMRSQGQSEAQVNQFIEQLKGAQKFSQQLEANQAKGLTEEQAARKAAGFSNTDMSRMEKMDRDIASMERMSADLAMERKQKEFDTKYGGYPDTHVTLGDQSYVLKTIECFRDGELFTINAEGRPGQGHFTFSANKRSGYAQGGYIQGVSFRIGDIDAGVQFQSGELVGSKYIFEGESEVTNIDTGDKQELPLKVTSICP